MQESDGGSSPQNVTIPDPNGYREPDVEIRECWANCNVESQEPITLRFDVFDRRTGFTYRNVTAICYQGTLSYIQLGFAEQDDDCGRPINPGTTEPYVTVDSVKGSAFRDAIEEALDYPLKSLLAVASREADYILDFPDFLAEFESGEEVDDGDQEVSEDHTD
jgi:hypothetical protein